MTYFKNIETLEQLRKTYKNLLKQYHPDNGGSEETMKAINVEYEQLFKILKNKHESKATGTENNTSSYENTKWNFEEDEKLREVLQKIINFEGISITIVGSWIWIDGNTYQYREQLKDVCFKWSKPRKKWYWHAGEYIRKGNSNTAFEILERKYGSTEVKTETRKKLATA